jgi:hypothetical protein
MRLLISLLVAGLLAVPATVFAHSTSGSGTSGATTTAHDDRQKQKAKKKKRKQSTTRSSVKIELRGRIATLGAGSITVRAVSCNVPAGFPIAGFVVGDLVEITCSRTESGWRLVRLKHEDAQDEATDDEREVKGTISALSQGSVTVGALTCAVPATLDLSRFAAGDFVELTCDLVRGVWTVRKLESEDTHESTRDDDDDHDDDDDDDDNSGPGGGGDDDD